MTNAKRTKAHKESVTFLRLHILSFPTVDESVCEPSCIQPYDSPLEERTAATLPSRDHVKTVRAKNATHARSLALSAFKHANRITGFLIDAAFGAAILRWNTRVSCHPRQLRRHRLIFTNRPRDRQKAVRLPKPLSLVQQPLVCATQEAPRGQLCLSSQEKRRQHSKLNGSWPS